MKRGAIAILVLLVMAGSVYALGDNKNEQKQQQAQGQIQGQSQVGINTNHNSNSNSNKNTNSNHNSSFSASGAISEQSQLGVVSQGNTQEVGGDTNKVNSVSYSYVGGPEGTSSTSLMGPLGGLGFSKTDKSKELVALAKAIESSPLDEAVKKDMINKLYNRAMVSIKTQRVLGIGWENEGSNILSPISWGSFWKDGPAQGVYTEKIRTPKTVDKGITGNGGYLK